MNYVMVGFMAFCWLGCTFVNQIMQGVFVGSDEVARINAMTVFREVSIFDLFTLPIPNLDFITQGIASLVKWDYSFFGGNAVIVSFFLQTLSIAFAFGLFITILGLLYNYFGRAR